MGVIPYVIVG